jgi:hypothetical protein
MPMPRLTHLSTTLRERSVDLWLPDYLRGRMRRTARRLLGPRTPGPVHLLVAVCDHFEPGWRTEDPARRDARATRWRHAYPELAARYRDADGRPPRHTFFLPIEDLRPSELDALAPLCRSRLAEVEVHLHHDGDDEDRLAARLRAGLTMLADDGHLSRALDGRPRFGFIHGNWALGNARPDGRHCGVDDELRVLFGAGCYADFTFPAYPDASQPRRVNRIDWPRLEASLRRGADRADEARVGTHHRDRLLLVHGPLVVAPREGGRGLRVDYGALTAHDPPTPERIANWLAADIHVQGRPEWQFVKLHTHGAPEAQAESLLGRGGHELHEGLAELVRRGTHRIHYVTARELYNIASAAMLGASGEPSRYRDLVLPPPPIAGLAQGT